MVGQDIYGVDTHAPCTDVPDFSHDTAGFEDKTALLGVKTRPATSFVRCGCGLGYHGILKEGKQRSNGGNCLIFCNTCAMERNGSGTVSGGNVSQKKNIVEQFIIAPS